MTYTYYVSYNNSNNTFNIAQYYYHTLVINYYNDDTLAMTTQQSCYGYDFYTGFNADTNHITRSMSLTYADSLPSNLFSGCTSYTQEEIENIKNVYDESFGSIFSFNTIGPVSISVVQTPPPTTVESTTEAPPTEEATTEAPKVNFCNGAYFGSILKTPQEITSTYSNLTFKANTYIDTAVKQLEKNNTTNGSTLWLTNEHVLMFNGKPMGNVLDLGYITGSSLSKVCEAFKEYAFSGYLPFMTSYYQTADEQFGAYRSVLAFNTIKTTYSSDDKSKITCTAYQYIFDGSERYLQTFTKNYNSDSASSKWSEIKSSKTQIYDYYKDDKLYVPSWWFHTGKEINSSQSYNSGLDKTYIQPLKNIISYIKRGAPIISYDLSNNHFSYVSAINSYYYQFTKSESGNPYQNYQTDVVSFEFTYAEALYKSYIYWAMAGTDSSSTTMHSYQFVAYKCGFNYEFVTDSNSGTFISDSNAAAASLDDETVTTSLT